jgi:hypothetical protein
MKTRTDPCSRMKRFTALHIRRCDSSANSSSELKENQKGWGKKKMIRQATKYGGFIGQATMPNI